MAFTFKGPTITGHISETDVILFQMIRMAGLDLPLLMHLDQEFYDSPRISREKVGALRDEAFRALRAFDASWDKRPSLFERTLALQTPAFHEMATGLRQFDPERCLAHLIAVCDDALEHNADVVCLSD